MMLAGALAERARLSGAEVEPFVPQRAGALYCSGRCRTAAHRRRHASLPITFWQGKEPQFSTAPSRARNYDGTPALSRGELAERLLKLTREGHNGEPKTGRRY